MNPNKIKQLAEKMGWKFHMTPGRHVLCETSNQIWNPEASNGDMVELLEKISGLFRVEIRKIGDKYEVTTYCFYSRECHATLRAAVVSFACKVWRIEE